MEQPKQKRYSDMEEVWAAYKRELSPELQEQLVVAYAPLVKKVVAGMGLRPDGPIEWDDLLNYGIIGLIDAIDRFDPDRGVQFSSFAAVRIRGAVLDALRQLDPLGRLARRRVKAAQEAIQQLTSKLGRIPEDEEVALEIGLTPKQYKQVLQDASFTILSLEQPIHGNGAGEQASRLADVIEDPNAIDSLESIEEDELRQRLIEAIRSLPQREQVLLSLYYYEGLTMREVATAMDISQTRVCQLHSRAIFNLKALMNPQSVKNTGQPEKGEDPASLPTDGSENGKSPAQIARQRRRARGLQRLQWREAANPAPDPYSFSMDSPS